MDSRARSRLKLTDALPGLSGFGMTGPGKPQVLLGQQVGTSVIVLRELAHVCASSSSRLANSWTCTTVVGGRTGPSLASTRACAGLP